MSVRMVWILATALVAGVSLTSCGLDNLAQCVDVCNRYQDCIDGDYDTEDCAESCTADADDNEDYERSLEQCEGCLDNQSCTESFACAAECAGIIP